MGRGTSRSVVVGAIAVLGGAGCPSQRVQNGHLTSQAQFGTSVSIAGQTAAVGAPQESDKFNQQGVVYVYEQAGNVWNLQARLVGSFPGQGDGFGAAVALSDSGDTLAVGAPNADGVGAAYVFQRSGTSWTEQAKLELPPPIQFDQSFGFSVALDGDTLVVGAPNRNPGAAVGAGAALVFQRTGTSWSNVATPLLEPSPVAGDTFGISVAVLGNTAFVGARHRTASVVADTGAVFVYQFTGTTWTLQQPALTANDSQPGDAFGEALAVSTLGPSLPAVRYLLIGAPGVTLGANGLNQAGAAYIFVSSGAAFTQATTTPRLTASDATGAAAFGSAVAASGSRVLVGAPTAASGGAAYVFDEAGGQWSQVGGPLSATGAAGAQLGTAVAVSSGFALAGASNEQVEPGQPGAGAVHAFREVVPGTWSASHRLTAAVSPPLSTYGTLIAVSADTLVAAGTSGLVGVYRRDLDGWSLTQQVPPASPATIGTVVGVLSVATDAGRLAIFAKHQTGIADTFGTITVYVRGPDGSWSFEDEIEPDLNSTNNPSQSADEGALAISGDRLAFGASRFNTGIGRVFVFTRSGSTWTEVMPPLDPVDAAVSASDLEYGQSVALQGGTLVVAEVPDFGSPEHGTVYVYNWTSSVDLVQTITADPALMAMLGKNYPKFDHFGNGMALSGDYLAIVGESLPGATLPVRVYKRSGVGGMFSVIFEEDGLDVPGKRGLALDGDFLAVGSPTFSVGIGNSEPNAGAVRIFQRQANDTFVQAPLWIPFDHAAGNAFGGFVVSAAGHLVSSAVGNVYGMDL